MDSSQQVLSTSVWRYLPTSSLLQLCETNRHFSQLCSKTETWQALLKRDFNNAKYQPDPRKKYFKLGLKKFADQKLKQLLKKLKGLETDEQVWEEHYYESTKIHAALGYDTTGDGMTYLYGNEVGMALVYFFESKPNLAIALLEYVGL